MATSRSAGGPQIPFPVILMAPKPSRLTVRSPPTSIVPASPALTDPFPLIRPLPSSVLPPTLRGTLLLRNGRLLPAARRPDGQPLGQQPGQPPVELVVGRGLPPDEPDGPAGRR